MFSSILLEAFHIRIINSDEDRFKKFNIYNNYEKRNNRNTKEFNLVLDEKLKEGFILFSMTGYNIYIYM